MLCSLSTTDELTALETSDVQTGETHVRPNNPETARTQSLCWLPDELLDAEDDLLEIVERPRALVGWRRERLGEFCRRVGEGLLGVFGVGVLFAQLFNSVGKSAELSLPWWIRVLRSWGGAGCWILDEAALYAPCGLRLSSA